LESKLSHDLQQKALGLLSKLSVNQGSLRACVNSKNELITLDCYLRE